MLTIKRAALLLSIWAAVACQPAPTPTAAPVTATPPFPSVLATSTRPPVLPSATSTLAPAPSTFKEDFAGGLPYWSFVQIENGTPAADSITQDGFLHFQLPEPNQWLYAFYAVPTYADVRIDARVATTAGTGGSPGLVCRYTEASGWYEFNIYADQTYTLMFGQWLAPGLARFTTLVQSTSEKIQPDENEIGLQCQGDLLTPYVNGTQLARRQDKIFGLKSGQVGVSASSFATAPLRISYDWVQVSEP